MLQISAATSVKAGEDAVLPCNAPRVSSVTVVEWSKDGLPADQYVYLYRNDRPYENYQHPSFRGRVENLFSISDGNFSVLIKNVTEDETGTYRCRVLMTSSSSEAQVEEHSESIQLELQAGNDEEFNEEESNIHLLWILVPVVVLIVAAVGGFVFYKCRKNRDSDNVL